MSERETGGSGREKSLFNKGAHEGCKNKSRGTLLQILSILLRATFFPLIFFLLGESLIGFCTRMAHTHTHTVFEVAIPRVFDPLLFEFEFSASYPTVSSWNSLLLLPFATAVEQAYRIVKGSRRSDRN